jgi:hypothetical protein
MVYMNGYQIMYPFGSYAVNCTSLCKAGPRIRPFLQPLTHISTPPPHILSCLITKIDVLQHLCHIYTFQAVVFSWTSLINTVTPYLHEKMLILCCLSSFPQSLFSHLLLFVYQFQDVPQVAFNHK